MSTAIAVPGVAFGRINWGRPLVDCPSPLCTSALVLEPGTPVYACWECPTRADIIWPDNLDDILLVLAQRKLPQQRNWDTQSLAELMAENLAAGDAPWTPEQLAAPRTGPLLSIVNDRIVAGRAALGGGL